MDKLKELRKRKGLTQAQASSIVDIPLRTYKLYENDPAKEGSIKYNYIAEKLSQYGHIDEEHGILPINQIEAVCKDILANYDVKYAILFGSYAMGMASDKSDVDLLICTNLKGLAFFGIVEELRAALHKKVDLLGVEQLNNNSELLNEILKYGVRVYG